jgi:hypothetical protein
MLKVKVTLRRFLAIENYNVFSPIIPRMPVVVS